ncbi:MAG: DUF5704 domain-containing protein, partial [Vallitaleaceae bacterium]|nr:DUF5704 domain-containing protein [Vallitaleaceae bacterium]
MIKKLITLLTCLVLMSNTIYGVPGDDGTDLIPTNIRIGEGGLAVEIIVDATKGNTGTKYFTTGYNVDFISVDGDFIERAFIPIPPSGTGAEIIHIVPIYSNGIDIALEDVYTGTNFNELMREDGVDLVFNGILGVTINGIDTGVYYDSLDKILATHEGKPYWWSRIALDAFPTRFDIRLPIPPTPRPTPPPPSVTEPTDTTITSSGVASSILAADTKGAEKFDVLQGIPSSESMYVNIGTDAFKMAYDINEYTGTYMATVTVTATVETTVLVPEVDENGDEIKDTSGNNILVPETSSNSVSGTYTYPFPYTFYDIEKLGVYGITSAVTTTGALGDSITMSPVATYRPPNVSVNHLPDFNSHITYNSSVSLGTFSSMPDLFALGQSRINFQVRNDYLSLNGAVLMDNTSVRQTAPAPVRT